MSTSGMMVFETPTRSCPPDIASYLDIPLEKAAVGQFSDGETMVEIQGKRPRA